MKLLASSLIALCCASPVLHAQTGTVCPNKAVFLVLPTQVRAYSTSGNGSTAPCQVIAGAATTLDDGNAIAISSHGFPRVSQFLSVHPVAVFAPNAAGNAAPYRLEAVAGNDLVSIATDGTSDYVLRANGGGQAFIDVTRSARAVAATFVVPALFVNNPAGGLAVSTDKNLTVAGFDINRNPLVETLGTAASETSPAVLRSIAGPHTGLLPASADDSAHNPISVAINPVNGEIFVYTYSYDLQTEKISVFAPLANGDVTPVRVIAGPHTVFGASGLKNNKIAVDSDGKLYVAESDNIILVFAADANGDVAPMQTIFDPSAPANADLGQAGIAVRN